MSDGKQKKDDKVKKDDEVKKEVKDTSEETSKKSIDNKKENKDVIHFQLSQSKIMWNSRSRNIVLNAFKQETIGEVNKKKNPEDYADVMNAINLGFLTQIKDDKDVKVFKSKDITAGKRQEDMHEKISKSYNTDEYLKMRQDILLPKIEKIDDPRLMIQLIRNEKLGKNETGVERQIVIDALNTRLTKIDKQGMFEYDGTL